MISNYQKQPQQTKSSLHESTKSKMSTMITDIGTAMVAASADNKHPVVNIPIEAVVVNSIIYSKPSFCRIAVDLGDIQTDRKSPKMLKSTNGLTCPNHIFHSKTCSSSSLDMQSLSSNFDAASCLAGLAASSSLDIGEDAKVYRICTTINGSIHHQISDLCDNILAMAEVFDGTNNDDKDDDDSFIEFAYGDDDDDDGSKNDGNDDDVEEDDDEEDYKDDYDEDDDNDVVDFSYECPIEPAPKLFYRKKKQVRFDNNPTVHVLHTWIYAHRTARKGEWEMYARDRERFKMRVERAALMLNPILEREHRLKIYENRFANLCDTDNDLEQRHQTTENDVIDFPTSQMMESKETSNNIESKKIHQKKKRRKKRFCKMGNKHYF